MRHMSTCARPLCPESPSRAHKYYASDFRAFFLAIARLTVYSTGPLAEVSKKVSSPSTLRLFCLASIPSCSPHVCSASYSLNLLPGSLRCGTSDSEGVLALAPNFNSVTSMVVHRLKSRLRYIIFQWCCALLICEEGDRRM
jgi:hypothetical protein